MNSRRIVRMAMVGGGPGSFIGPVHRMAAELDGNIRLVAGAFSRDAARSREAGAQFGIDPARTYDSYQDMCERERGLADSPDFVAIVTPNHEHLPVARAALAAGFHVLSDKPATATLDEARELQRLINSSRLLYGLTHTYTGYGLVREAREICGRGELGAIRKVVAEYFQGWLSERLETAGVRQAEWRCDPARAGAGGCSGDIGTHAFNLIEFVTGHRVTRIAASLSSVVPERTLDDDCNVLLRLDNGAPGVLFASQIAAGERNGLRLRVYGDKGGLDWAQENPNQLTTTWLDGSARTLHGAGNSASLSPGPRAAFRLPLGHPEGFIEAFANLYRDFAAAIVARETNGANASSETIVPGIEAGVRGLAFVDAAVRSSRAGSSWVAIE